MNRKISILDCTLRDGGCVNNFEFGTLTMKRLIRQIEGSGAEYIETGYLHEREGSPETKTRFSDMAALSRQLLGPERKSSVVYAVMIDYGTWPIRLLPKRSEHTVDMIRLCFHKKDAQMALDYGREILRRGYQLTLQPMVANRYTDEEYRHLLTEAAKKLPELHAFYLVDSFGCMEEEELLRRVLLVDQVLPPSIAMGLHTHNNLGRSLSNAKLLLEQKLERPLLIDSTLYGMGKGAGNLPTEELMEYLNAKEGKQYCLDSISEAIRVTIQPFDRVYRWGACEEYALSARYHLTPGYAKLFYRQLGYSLEQTEELFRKIAEEKKDSFDRDYAMELAKELFGPRPQPEPYVALHDARGYEIVLETESAGTVLLNYLGAEKTEHPGFVYDEDPYVTSHVERQELSGPYACVLKDSGITKSGLRISLSAKEAAKVRISVCGEWSRAFEISAGETVSELFALKDICREEKAYLDQIHRILYRLLGEVDRVCRLCNIHYYLVFGGLLGVERHHDIIPWDDDVDIAMTRKDFEIFRKTAAKELGPAFRYLDCSQIGGFLDFMCRVLYLEEDVPVNVFRKVSGQCDPALEHKLALDIFILDKAADDEKKHARHMLLMKAVYGLGMGHRSYVDPAEYRNRDRNTQRAVAVLSRVGKLVPLPLIFWLHDRISTRYEARPGSDYFMSDGYLPFIHTRYKQRWFVGEQRERLGEMMVNVPACHQEYLKRAYYDYYHLPPVEKRKPSHSPKADGIH